MPGRRSPRRTMVNHCPGSDTRNFPRTWRSQEITKTKIHSGEQNLLTASSSSNRCGPVDEHESLLAWARTKTGSAAGNCVMPDIGHFAQVARHPDGDRVVVSDWNGVRAEREENLAGHFNGRAVIAEFSEAARAHYGASMKGLDYVGDLERTGKSLRACDVRRILSMNQAPSVRGSEVAIPESKPLHVLLVGGGPRSSLQVCAEIDLLMRPDIQSQIRKIMALGGTYDIRTTIVEKQGSESIGRGVAWNKDQEGTANNTGADYPGCAKRVRRLYVNEKEALLASVADSHVGRAFYLSAYPKEGGLRLANAAPEPRTDRSATLRKHFGEEEHRHFQSRLHAAQEDELLRQIYKVQVLPHTEVIDVDTSCPLGSKLAVKGPAGAAEKSIDADVVRLNTGTQLASPLNGAQQDIVEHSYIGPMSGDRLAAFLAEKGLLDDRGRLKPGTKVLTGGTSLSLYDQLLALERVMKLTEIDAKSPLGYRITEDAKEKYRDAILITSRTEGKWISPKHSQGAAWNQELAPVGSAREQHAMFLHNQGEELFKAWQDICVATVAAATGRTTATVKNEGMTTSGVLALQKEENDKHLRASSRDEDKTLYGARRQAYLSSMVGLGLERDFRGAAADLSEKAPLTYAGRAGMLISRAQTSAITDPNSSASRRNRPLMDVYATRMQDIQGSPTTIQALAQELIDAGIASYTVGSYDGIRVDKSGKRLVFIDGKGERTEHDFFLVSPVFNREANPVERSLAGKVDPIDARIPSAGRMGANRMLLRPDGAPLSVESYGLGASGVRPDEKSVLGLYAHDIAHKASGAQVATGLACRRLAEQHLAAAGRLDPVGDVEAIYQALLAGMETDYNVEVEKFRGAFDEGMQKAAFLRVAARMATGPAEYRELYQAADDPQRRAELGGEAYRQEVQQIPAFNPPSCREYFGRFVDFTDRIHQQVYEKAFEEARQSMSGILINAA